MDNWAAQVAVQFFFCGWGSSVIVNYRRWVAKGPSGRGNLLFTPDRYRGIFWVFLFLLNGAIFSWQAA